MACGVPSVTYDVAGPRHTIGAVDRSLLVSVGNVEAFAERLASLLMMETPAFAMLAGRARAAAARYRYSVVAEETLRAYESARYARRSERPPAGLADVASMDKPGRA
jgi:glycosyltransferase involved in cell wall biosynthesis